MSKDAVIALSQRIEKIIDEFYKTYEVYPNCLFLGFSEEKLLTSYGAREFKFSRIPPYPNHSQKMTTVMTLHFCLIDECTLLDVGLVNEKTT